MDCEDRNAQPRELWLKERHATIPAGARILDAGAGELSQKKYCEHLDYLNMYRKILASMRAKVIQRDCKQDRGISQNWILCVIVQIFQNRASRLMLFSAQKCLNICQIHFLRLGNSHVCYAQEEYCY